MQTLDAFMSRLLPLVPGCPDTLVRQALVDTAIEFCESTLIVQGNSAPQTATVDVGSYTLTVPAQQAVTSVLNVWYGTKQLRPAAALQIDAILAYVSGVGTTTAEKGTPDVFYELSPGVIGIYPVPNVTTASYLSARMALRPTRTATSLEDVLLNDWVDGIVSGAEARLRDIPNQPFSGDSTLARAKFNVARQLASNLRVRGRVSGSVSVRPRPIV